MPRSSTFWKNDPSRFAPTMDARDAARAGSRGGPPAPQALGGSPSPGVRTRWPVVPALPVPAETGGDSLELREPEIPVPLRHGRPGAPVVRMPEAPVNENRPRSGAVGEVGGAR